ncbi:MAG: Uma2 family endonuclease [Bacteroidia bacterium]
MKSAVNDISEVLVYEMVNGIPVYYRGYKDYLKGTKNLDEIMGSSYLQALISTQLIILLSQLLDPAKFRILSNEIGLKFSKKSWRAADIAIYEKDQLANIPIENKYLEIPPKVVIEIDTKAEMDEIQNPLGYYQEKTDQLLSFGVEKVIWIFTDTQKIMVATQGEDWQIFPWNKEFEVLPSANVNIAVIIESA